MLALAAITGFQARRAGGAEAIRSAEQVARVARRLGISERTVKAHVTHILQRLGLGDRTQAALWAERQLGTTIGLDQF